MNLSVYILGWVVGGERIRIELKTEYPKLWDYLQNGRIKSIKKSESDLSFEILLKYIL